MKPPTVTVAFFPCAPIARSTPYVCTAGTITTIAHTLSDSTGNTHANLTALNRSHRIPPA